MLINVPGTHGKYYCNNISNEKYPKKYWSSKCIPDYSILDKLPNNISTEKYTNKRPMGHIAHLRKQLI